MKDGGIGFGILDDHTLGNRLKLELEQFSKFPVAREFSEYLNMQNIVKVHIRIGPWQLPDASIVLFTRRDTMEHIRDVQISHGKTPRAALVEMAASAMYIDEKQRKIVKGDLSIPYHKCEEKAEQLKQVSCPVEKIHRHEFWDWGNVCHIHVHDCDLKGTLKMIKVAQVLSS